MCFNLVKHIARALGGLMTEASFIVALDEDEHAWWCDSCMYYNMFPREAPASDADGSDPLATELAWYTWLCQATIKALARNHACIDVNMLWAVSFMALKEAYDSYAAKRLTPRGRVLSMQDEGFQESRLKLCNTE
jgi:hypothetical protein